MSEEDMAETILEIYTNIRNAALQDEETPMEEIGVEVSYDQVIYGVRLSDYDETLAMIEGIGDCDSDEEMEDMGDIFFGWLQENIFQPLADEAIGKLVDKGYLECTGMDGDGEFVFKPTAKGKADPDWNLDDFA